MPLPRRNFLFGIAALPATNLFAGRPLPGLTTTVYNGYELHTALQAAGPGSRLLLAPGNYGDIGQFVLASSNISVRVQAPSRTIFRAPLVVTGNQVDLDGLALMEDVHLAGLGLVIGNSLFVGSGLKLTGVDSEVHHCDFGQYKCIHPAGAALRGHG